VEAVLGSGESWRWTGRCDGCLRQCRGPRARGTLQHPVSHGTADRAGVQWHDILKKSSVIYVTSYTHLPHSVSVVEIPCSNGKIILWF